MSLEYKEQRASARRVSRRGRRFIGIDGAVLTLHKRANLEFHSFMVIRHGKIAVEWYNEPYTADTSHSMYSVSKTFSATAIGFAVSEGLLSLDDKVLDFSPNTLRNRTARTLTS